MDSGRTCNRFEAGDRVITPDSVVGIVTGDRSAVMDIVDVEIGDFVQACHINDIDHVPVDERTE